MVAVFGLALGAAFRSSARNTRMTMPRSRALKSWVAGFRRYRIILAAQATKR
jgi:hypothetical protein